MSRNLIVGAMQAQVEYGLKNTTLMNAEEIQAKYNIANRRAIRAIMRCPIYGANEATEMELGIKKITQLCSKSTLNHIGKMALEEGTLHNHLFKKAKQLNSKTIRYWR